MRALASPASLKNVLSAREAAAALAQGLRSAGADAEELPVADGGEGTADALGASVVAHVIVPDAFGEPREARLWALGDEALVEAADAIPFDPARLDPFAASSRGLGVLLGHVRSARLIVALGGTATMDAGAGLLATKPTLPAETTVLADTQATLLDAPRLFGPQKGASPADVADLERRFAAMAALQPYADLPGSGAAGGLGAAFASLGARLVPGARFVLERLRFADAARTADLVITGEGRVDETTSTGKAPGAVVSACRSVGVRCVVFGGRVEHNLAGAEMVELSGDPSRAREDLVELGRRCGRGPS